VAELADEGGESAVADRRAAEGVRPDARRLGELVAEDAQQAGPDERGRGEGGEDERAAGAERARRAQAALR